MPLDGPPGDGDARQAGMGPGLDTQPDIPVYTVMPAHAGTLPASASPGGVAATTADPPATALARASPDQAGAHARPSGARLDLPTCLIAAGVFAAYTVISVFRYLRRDPSSWDLGIFTEYVKQYAHLRAPIVDVHGAGFNLFGDHFHPIVALIAPFFRVFPTPVTLLVAQALLAAVSVFPVSRAGRELLGDGQGRAIAAAYGFSWGLQQLANSDFHEIAFAVPLLAFSLSALARGRIGPAVLWAMPLVFVKEDQGFTLAAIGLILAFAYRRYGDGLFLIGWGLFWSSLAILVILPHFNASHTYAYWVAGGALKPMSGHIGFAELWGNLANGVGTKLPTLAVILLPTAFIALRSPLVLAVLPSLLLRFLGTNSVYWSTSFHYSATVMPIVFIAAIDAMARIRDRRPVGEARWAATRWPRGPALAAERYGAAVMLGACAALAFQFPLSSLWSPSTYQLGPHVAAENAAVALVPDGATVATDLNLLAPLAARTDTFWLGNAGTNPATQYVVFDNQSPDWPPQTNPLSFVESLTHNTLYEQIYASHSVYVFRRLG